jgi:transcription initiation factor TFIID subunit TAF12
MFFSWTTPVLILSSAALFSCKPRNFNGSDSTSSSGTSSTSLSQSNHQKVDEIWRLMRAEHLKDIQPQCEPMR